MPDISVIILNYNGAAWLERCIESLERQTCRPRMEVIIADNLSPDGSGQMAEKLARGMAGGQFLQCGANLGFCAGNNRAAELATGEFLFFLNNDTWLEPDCLERLLAEVRRAGADGGTPIVLDYTSDTVQACGAAGLDVLGLPSPQPVCPDTVTLFAWCGCSLLIRRELFQRLGGFDPAFFMYGEETDLSWRAWLAGARGVLVPSARLHHRGEANANPAGGPEPVESRTHAMKRFYTNRNGLLTVLKNAQHILWLLAVCQALYLALEGVVWLIVSRRPGFIRRAYWDAGKDCWRLRSHIRVERQRLAGLRQRSDFWMVRFLRWRLNRWTELLRLRRFGPPRISGDPSARV